MAPRLCIASTQSRIPFCRQKFPNSSRSHLNPVVKSVELTAISLVPGRSTAVISERPKRPSFFRTKQISTPDRSKFTQGYTLDGKSGTGTIILSPGFHEIPPATVLRASDVFEVKQISEGAAFISCAKSARVFPTVFIQSG